MSIINKTVSDFRKIIPFLDTSTLGDILRNVNRIFSKRLPVHPILLINE